MKTFLTTLALAAAIGFCAVAAEPEAKKLQHVVAFKFKENATPEQIKNVEDAFRGMKDKIPQIAALEWGTNNSPEGLNKGFTHCFLVTFRSERDREIYLPHPEHKAFVAVLKPVLEDVFVIDYWARD
jgi:hypothetical protein